MLRDAHAEDFERKRKPELGRDPRNTKVEQDDDTDDESDEHEHEDADSGLEDNENRDSDGSLDPDDEEDISALARIREDLEVGMSGAVSR